MATVLVVEDEKDIRHLVVISLIRWGYQPIEAVTPDSAKELEKPDLAIIDLRLQGRIDAGISLCQWVKEHWQIPVIATTAYDSDELRKVVEPFSDAFCIKPTVLDCIHQALNQLLPVTQGAD